MRAQIRRFNRDIMGNHGAKAKRVRKPSPAIVAAYQAALQAQVETEETDETS
ncbi:MAG: hypothetical protein KGL39_04410 [Patescibacteria group bacterium]|nr:hypothetical protein [Patescibacteria group bacterium]